MSRYLAPVRWRQQAQGKAAAPHDACSGLHSERSWAGQRLLVWRKGTYVGTRIGSVCHCPESGRRRGLQWHRSGPASVTP